MLLPVRFFSIYNTADLGCLRFTDLKNGFRIEHAKQLLSEKKDPRFTIDGVGLQAGFASSSNFYATFKEVTGMTPNQWIEAPSNSSPDIIGINSGGA